MLRGYAVTALENIVLWHERDISHSSAERIILPGRLPRPRLHARNLHGVMDGLDVYPRAHAAQPGTLGGLVFSQQVLLALVENGLDRQDAYAVRPA